MSRGSGRELAWEQLLSEQISQNGRLFFSLAHGLLRNPQAAEDVCQQALLKAWENRGQIEKQQSLRAWIARVVVNESLRLRRRGVVERKWVQEAAAPGLHGGGRRHPEMDVKDSVTDALEKLPEAVRNIVVLRIMEGLSGQEVAQLVGCSAASVSRQMYEGMERLRELLLDWQNSGEKS